MRNSSGAEEFDRQVENLVRKGYPKLARMSRVEFVRRLQPLRKKIPARPLRKSAATDGRLDFVLVVKSSVVSAGTAMKLVRREGKRGMVSMAPVAPDDFKAIKGVTLPGGWAYLLIDFDRGKETLNITPEKALKRIRKKRRSPLTMEEGLAVITHHPECLKKNNCFSLPGSRRGDQRVPALWLSRNRPKLGWCWDRNPHSWLGSASCRVRVGSARIA